MLTTEQILDAAEDVLRRYGPRKTTVIDVARALNVSHGTVYRHFATKAALHEAITARWLDRMTSPLAEVAASNANPKQRLRDWFGMLFEIKRGIVNSDPELFESYSIIAKKAKANMKDDHINLLLEQIRNILDDGIAEGFFVIDDPVSMARTLFFGTVRYHHPIHSPEWGDSQIESDFNNLMSLLEKALTR